jgi:molecular chaperone DnaK
VLCGIDFGTRNTAIVKGTRRVTGPSGGTIPSFVAYSRIGLPRTIGERARSLLDDPNSSSSWDVHRSFKLRLPTSDGSPNCRPTSLAADFLSDALALPSAGSSPVTGAVMAIPVGWAPAARRALRRAAEQAGIRLAGFVSESTAAFAKYRDRFGSVDEVAVFDWGAGTLDVSVLRIAGGHHGVSSIEERHCARSDAAGDTIDTVIAQRLHRQMQQADHSLPEWEQIDPDERTRLCHQAEFAKIAFSSHPVESMPIVLANYFGKSRTMSLSAADFDRAAEPVIDGAVATLLSALAIAGTTERRVDAVLVVGGCAKIRGLESRLRSIFGERLHVTSESEWAVAEGAQRIAEAGQGSYACVQEFCMILSDGLALPLTDPGARFDGSAKTHVVGKIDDSPAAMLVFGERSPGQSSEPRTVGSLSVRSQGLPGEPIEVTASLDQDLFLRVRACPLLGKPSLDTVSFEYPHTRFEYRL